MNRKNDRVMEVLKAYSKAIEQVSLIGDSIHCRARNIRRVLDRIDDSPGSEIAVSDGYKVPPTTAFIIDDDILSFDEVSTEKLHRELTALAEAMQEKKRLEACLRKTEYANLIRD